VTGKRYLALDVGGSKIEAGLVTDEGHLLGSHRVRARPFCSREEFLGDLAGALAPFAGEPASGMGVGLPLLGDYHSGVLEGERSLYPCLERFPLGKHLRRTSGLPVRMTTDANMLALGIARFGEGRRYSSFIAITLGTGVGVGLIEEDRLVEGRQGPPDKLLQAFRGWERAHYHAGHYFRELYGCDGETLAARAAAGDAHALDAFETVGTALGETIRRLLSVCPVEAVILAGGICASWRFFSAQLRRAAGDAQSDILRTELPHPALVGAAALWP
jgi:glucokinase